MARPGLPTRRADWRLMVRTVRLVLGVPAYAGVALLAGVAALSLFTASQNLPLVEFALTGSLPLANRVIVLVGLLDLPTLYGLLPAALLVGVAALTGVDVALVAYHVREGGLAVREGGGGVAGLALATLGAGCAACGSALLAGVLSLVGAAGATTLLPLDGLEFALLAVPALVLSIYWIAEGMRGTEVRGCPVDLDR